MQCKTFSSNQQKSRHTSTVVYYLRNRHLLGRARLVSRSFQPERNKSGLPASIVLGRVVLREDRWSTDISADRSRRRGCTGRLIRKMKTWRDHLPFGHLPLRKSYGKSRNCSSCYECVNIFKISSPTCLNVRAPSSNVRVFFLGRLSAFSKLLSKTGIANDGHKINMKLPPAIWCHMCSKYYPFSHRILRLVWRKRGETREGPLNWSKKLRRNSRMSNCEKSNTQNLFQELIAHSW